MVEHNFCPGYSTVNCTQMDSPRCLPTLWPHNIDGVQVTDDSLGKNITGENRSVDGLVLIGSNPSWLNSIQST